MNSIGGGEATTSPKRQWAAWWARVALPAPSKFRRMATLTDSGPHAVKLGRDGSVYVGIGLVAAIIGAAVAWGSLTARLERVEKDSSRAATSDQVERLERRMENIEALLMRRERQDLP